MSDLNTDATNPEESSVILPPPAIRSIVEKTAAYVAKSPNAAQFEAKIRAREKSDSRFAFLNADDAYHPYYQQRLQTFREGEVGSPSTGDTAGLAGEKAPVGSVPATVVVDTNKDEDEMPTKPPALEFIVEQLPAINAVDLDILKLTALFTARSGRRFTSELASREGRNYQFDFLRPTHSLFGHFNRLVEQYTKILMPSDEFRNGLRRRCQGTLDSNPRRVTSGRREVLSDSQQRVDWQAWDMSRRRDLEDAQEAQRVAFAEIDWQDFVVASTIDFTEADEAALTDLPPPMSLSEVENMTIAQKKMAAMIMEGKNAGQDNTDSDDDETAAMDMRGDGDDEQANVPHGRDQSTHQPTAVPSPIVEIRAADTTAPMKIRKDYVPKANRPAAPSQAFTIFNNQQVPVEEFASHVRIELLDPKWKEDKRQSEVNRSTANLLPQGTDVSSSIRDLAAHRPDIFGAGADDEARRKQEQAEALARSKKRELGVWDGHTTTKDAITTRYQAGANLDEQIEALHRAKGLVGSQSGTTPVIGPTVPTLSNIDAASASTETSTPSSVMASVLPAAHHPTLVDKNPHSTRTPSMQITLSPGQDLLPTAMTASAASIETPGAAGTSQVFDPLSSSSAGVSTDTNRPAETSPDEEPIAKRARVSVHGNSNLRSEAEWLSAHGPDPIKIQIQLPEYPAKPAWGCDGSSFSLEVPLTLLVGTIRDRITSKVGLPVSKQKLLHNGRILANSSTLAALNFEEGDQIHVAIKEKK
ncbi:BQ2448_7418 [Microbotryum intermedium]|uniref:BQ2448_7418 protein n=1 Tax=Microbotryum intermedium TaxID=269621 RepID=A0A238FI80_9BASI|nr:BQ2448_7418 [Microbotryum intermedium]